MRKDITKSCLLGLLGLLGVAGAAQAQTGTTLPAQSYPTYAPVVSGYPTAVRTPAQTSASAASAYFPAATGQPVATPLAQPCGPVAAAPCCPPAPCCPAPCCKPAPCCPKPCNKCIIVPTTITRVKVLYGEKCVDYCLPMCRCCGRRHAEGHCPGGCDAHDYGLCQCLGQCRSCGHPRTKHILLKREVEVECPSFKCVPPCGEAVGLGEGVPLPVTGTPTLRPGAPLPQGTPSQPFRLPEGPPEP
jgi:hypothetical protein